ncbi:MAG: hypothetical protein WAO35_19095 [Terriglobia bacterium]
MNHEQLGPPGITIGGLQIWVHGRTPSDSPASLSDWLTLTAHCGGEGADVWVHGQILMLSEIRRWVEDCERARQHLSSRAELGGVEPQLFVAMMVSDNLERVQVMVSITPDYLRQQHKFMFELEQSYITTMIREGKTVLSNLGYKVDTP